MARIALGAEDAREQIEIRHTSFLLKMVCYSEMSQSVIYQVKFTASQKTCHAAKRFQRNGFLA